MSHHFAINEREPSNQTLEKSKIPEWLRVFLATLTSLFIKLEVENEELFDEILLHGGLIVSVPHLSHLDSVMIRKAIERAEKKLREQNVKIAGGVSQTIFMAARDYWEGRKNLAELAVRIFLIARPIKSNLRSDQLKQYNVEQLEKAARSIIEHQAIIVIYPDGTRNSSDLGDKNEFQNRKLHNGGTGQVIYDVGRADHSNAQVLLLTITGTDKIMPPGSGPRLWAKPGRRHRVTIKVLSTSKAKDILEDARERVPINDTSLVRLYQKITEIIKEKFASAYYQELTKNEVVVE